MPDASPPPLKHLRFRGEPLVLNYKGDGRGQKKLFRRDRPSTLPTSNDNSPWLFPEDHEHHNCHERRVRYSLIVSIETEAGLPIYPEIETAMIKISAPAPADDLEVIAQQPDPPPPLSRHQCPFLAI